jgi:hypothetical protein
MYLFRILRVDRRMMRGKISRFRARSQCFTPVILAVREAEIRKIVV